MRVDALGSAGGEAPASQVKRHGLYVEFAACMYAPFRGGLVTNWLGKIRPGGGGVLRGLCSQRDIGWAANWKGTCARAFLGGGEGMQ